MTYESIYNRVKKATFASGVIANGYNGDKENVQFSIVDGTVYMLHFTGCCKAAYPGLYDVQFTTQSDALTAIRACGYVQNVKAAQ